MSDEQAAPVAGADEAVTSTDLVPAEEERVRLLANTFTGEAIDLDAPSEQLRELDEERKQLVRDVSHELLQRMDRDAKWTQHFPGLDISGDTPNRREYKTERLVAVLEDLVREGKISREAAQSAVEREIRYKVKKRGVDAIKKLGGEISKRIYGTEVPIPDAARRVSVKAKEVIDA